MVHKASFKGVNQQLCVAFFAGLSQQQSERFPWGKLAVQINLKKACHIGLQIHTTGMSNTILRDVLYDRTDVQHEFNTITRKKRYYPSLTDRMHSFSPDSVNAALEGTQPRLHPEAPRVRMRASCSATRWRITASSAAVAANSLLTCVCNNTHICIIGKQESWQNPKNTVFLAGK
jgi:hypothetical protein